MSSDSEIAEDTVWACAQFLTRIEGKSFVWGAEKFALFFLYEQIRDFRKFQCCEIRTFCNIDKKRIFGNYYFTIRN